VTHIIPMTRRDFGKPAFSLRTKRCVKTHALSLLGTTRLLSRSVGRFLPIKPVIGATIQPQETEFKSLALSSGCFSYVQKEKE
ncbi:MAG: hypothetical protein WC856_26465, partial [Methylococcaceae bacterium]